MKRSSNKLDVALLVSDRPAVAAGVYTQNVVCGAPVHLNRERTPSESIRAVVINSGIANACTGEQGMRDAVDGKVPAKDTEANQPLVRKLVQARRQAAVASEQSASADFLMAEARKPGAKQTESGLIITELKAGTGASPTATDKVKVHTGVGRHDIRTLRNRRLRLRIA